MPKFLLLNGPPKSGKDAIVQQLREYITFHHLKFAMPMKAAIAAMFDIPMGQLENFKDVPSHLLQHRDTTLKERRDTMRELLIAFSEDFLKPKYGDDFLGRVFWQHAKQSACNLIIATDIGFEAETERVISNAGAHNCRLIRLHRDGTSFDGDSRSYIRDGLCTTYDVPNNGTLYEATMRVLYLAKREFDLKLLKEPEWIK